MGLFDVFKGAKAAGGPVILGAAASGTFVPMKEIPDDVFAKGVLGTCWGIEPAEGKAYAPVDGTVIQVHDTLHALGLSGPDGTELLVHVGIDTVDMNGEGFSAKVKEGDKVKKGQLLLTMDLKRIRAAGHPTTVVTVLTNSDDYASQEWIAEKEVKQGADILKVSR